MQTTASKTRLRQIAFAAVDIDSAAALLGAEMGLEVAHRDPWVGTFGLQNIVLPIGDHDFLEIVSPISEHTAVSRFLARNGQGGYMLIFECPDVYGARAEADAMGVRVVQAVEDQQHTSFQLHPKDCDGIMLSLDSLSDQWLAAGPNWPAYVRTGIATGITALEFAVAEPADVAARWARLTGADIEGCTLTYSNVRIDLVQTDRGQPGLRAIHVARGEHCPYDSGAIWTFCGVDFVFVENQGGLNV